MPQRGSFCGVQPCAQNFGDAPCLRDAAARGERRFRVENLVDGSDAALVQVVAETVQATARPGAVLRIYFEPGVDERPNEPGPDGALVVGRIARTQVAEVFRFIIRMAGRQCAQSQGSQQFFARDPQHGFPSILLEDRVLEGDCEKLIRPACRIVSMFAIDDVVEIVAIVVPKALVEGIPGASGVVGAGGGGAFLIFLAQPGFEQAERIIPKRVDFDGLAPARGDYPVVHLCVHPGELDNPRRPG